MTSTTNKPTNAVRQLTRKELEIVGGGQHHDPYHMPLSNQYIGVVAAQIGIGAALLGVAGGKK
jgi:hypothetical protein